MMETFSIALEQAKPFFMEYVLPFLLRFVLPLIIVFIVWRIANKVFNSTMFTKSGKKKLSTEQLSLEVKRLAFPAVLVGIYCLARSMFKSIIDLAGTELLQELLAEAALGDTVGVGMGKFYFIINVIVPLIISVPVIITAILCIRTGKEAVKRFLSLLVVSAMICTFVGILFKVFVFIALQTTGAVMQLFGGIFTVISMIITIGGSIILYSSLAIWIIPAKWLQFLGFMRQRKEAEERKKEPQYTGKGSGNANREYSNAENKRSASTTNRSRFPETLRIGGEIYHLQNDSFDNATYYDPRTGNTVHLRDTDLPGND